MINFNNFNVSVAASPLNAVDHQDKLSHNQSFQTKKHSGLICHILQNGSNQLSLQLQTNSIL